MALILIRRLSACFIGLCFFCAVPGPAFALTEDKALVYTVQTGSYKVLDRALQAEQNLRASFPEQAADVRIESHPPYFALRVGSFSAQGPAERICLRLKKAFPGAFVLKAGYIQDRIISKRKIRQAAPSSSIKHSRPGINPVQPSPGRSLVPSGERMSDSETRLMIAGLLTARGSPDDLKQALHFLNDLGGTGSARARADQMRIKVLAAMGKGSKALELAKTYLNKYAFDALVWADIADVLSLAGYLDWCRDIYLQVLNRTQGDVQQGIRLRFADKALLWGDYYASEAILGQALELDEDNPELLLKMADNLTAQQRFVKARQYFQNLLRDSTVQSSVIRQVWTKMINLGLLEKNYELAAKNTDELISRHGIFEDMLLPGARAFFEAGRLEEAEDLYSRALTVDGLKDQALVGLGRVMIRQGDEPGADRYLLSVPEKSSSYPLAMILYYKEQEKDPADFAAEYARTRNDPAELESLAGILSTQGFFGLSAQVFQSALENDSNYLPARFGLAQVLGASGRYRQALEEQDFLLDIFPDSYKLALTRARILAWSRNYEAALELYQDIHERNRSNPVVLTEAARTAYWGKMAVQGNEFYARIYEPGVDELLLKSLAKLMPAMDDPDSAGPFRQLEKKVQQGSVYEGFEYYQSWFRQHREGLTHEDARRIRQILLGLNHVYVQQKRAVLEQRSKDLTWNRRFAPAQRSLEKLVRFDPGNQEALFDLAQTCCSLGLGSREKEIYSTLLNLDPLHRQAGRALKRVKMRSRPMIRGNYLFRQEKGRGILSRMTRHRFDLGLELPLYARHSFSLVAHRYLASPQEYGKTAPARGMTLGGNINAGPYLDFYGSITRKSWDRDLKVRNYSRLTNRSGTQDSFETALKDMTLGNLNMRVNLDNYAALSLGFAKQEEAANVLALAQGIHSRRYRSRLDVYPARKLDMSLEAEFIDYSDGNSGHIYSGEIGYVLTDHPRTLKGVLSAGYRDTSQEYRSCPGFKDSCGITRDFAHPYWTPQDYWETALTLEFRHDLARDYFCGARENFYHLQLTVGTEQNSNNSVELRGRWVKELTDRFGFNVQGMWHYSRDWKAMEADLGLFYRF